MKKTTQVSLLIAFLFGLASMTINAQVCGGQFLDSGGVAAGYLASENSTTTILPVTAGDVVTITFTYVDMEANTTGVGTQDGCWDFMTVYNGPDATFPVLAQTLCGEQSGDGDVPSVASSLLSVGDSYTSTDVSGALTIVFMSDTSVQETGWEANITCGPPPTCLQPTAPAVTNITSSSADFSWTPGATETLWDVELVDITGGGVVTGIPTATGVSNPYTLLTLTDDNDYEVYVRADCLANGVSAWTGPTAFRTLCATFSAPYSEDFELFTTSASAFLSGNCWAGTGGTYYWEAAPGTDTGSGGTGPAPSITTGNYFYTEASAGTAGDITDLISPLVDLSTLTAPSLSFDYHMFGVNMGTLEVIVSVGGTPTTELSIIGQQQATELDPFINVIVDLAAYAGQTVQVTFRGISAGTFEGDMAIDNILIDELPSCIAPSLLAISNITAATADFAWTPGGTETLWDVELVDITGGGVVTGIPTATGVSNPYTFTSLVDNNNYEAYVRADCVADGTSVWQGPIAFTTTVLCPEPTTLSVSNVSDNSATLDWFPGGAETLWDIEIVDITAAGIPTGVPTTMGIVNPYIQMGLTADNDYEFYVRADCVANGVSVWAGPFAFRTACLAFATPYTEDFELFTTAASAFVNENCWSATGGAYYWEAAPGTDTGSTGTGPSPTVTTGNYFYTEATGGATGDMTDLMSPLIDLSTLTAPSLAFDYHMFGVNMGTLEVIVTAGGIPSTELSLIGQQQTLETDSFVNAVVDLAAYAGQTVQVTFRGTKGAGFEGDMSIDNIVFDELPACITPSSLVATVVTETTADFTWVAGGSETAWEYANVLAPSTDPVSGTTIATPAFSAGSLTPFTVYDFYVRADCGAGTFSNWIKRSYMTLPTAPANDECAGAIALTINPDLGCADVTAGTTVGATASAEIDDVTGTPNTDVWYSFVATGSQHTIALQNIVNQGGGTSTSTDMGMGVYDATGGCGAGLVFFDDSDPNTLALSGLVATTTYYVRVYGWGTTIQYNNFDICVGTPPPPPANDECAAAVALTVNPDPNCTSVTAGTIASATDSGVNVCGGTEDDDVWYSFVATSTSHIVSLTNITGGTLDLYHAVYDAAAGCGALTTALTCSDPNTSTTSGLTIGNTYFVQVYSWTATAGQTSAFDICVSTPAPANDECASAVPLTLGVLVSADNTGATNSGFTSTCDTAIMQDVWFSFVATANAQVDIATTAANFAVHADCATTAAMHCTTDGTNVAGLTNGTTYYVRVWDDGIPKAPGAFDITITESSLSVPDLDANTLFSYYPNPVESSLILNAQKNISNITVYNMLGQVIHRNTPNTLTIEVPMSNLPSGAYFVQVTVDNATETIRVIKE